MPLTLHAHGIRLSSKSKHMPESVGADVVGDDYVYFGTVMIP